MGYLTDYEIIKIIYRLATSIPVSDEAQQNRYQQIHLLNEVIENRKKSENWSYSHVI